MQPNKELFEAISANDLQTIVNIFSENGSININSTDEHGMSLLQHACYKGHLQIAQYLIERGADINQNDHEHQYTALMFAALGGHCELIDLLLDHGANTNATNTVNRNASQMAAFVGQHRSVAIINNHVPRACIEYYTKITGLETEPRLPIRFVNSMVQFVRLVNINPVRIVYFLKANASLLENSSTICKVLELLCEKFFKMKDPKETLSMKMHYLGFILNIVSQGMNQARQNGHLQHNSKEELQQALNALIRKWIKVNDDEFPETLERLIRESVRTYPYQDNSLFQQLVRTLASVQIGEEPNSLSIVCQTIIGRAADGDESAACSTCSEPNSSKRCSKCKVATYCDQNCQKLHWPIHKHVCDKWAQRHQNDKRNLDENGNKFSGPPVEPQTNSA